MATKPKTTTKETTAKQPAKRQKVTISEEERAKRGQVTLQVRLNAPTAGAFASIKKAGESDPDAVRRLIWEEAKREAEKRVRK